MTTTAGGLLGVALFTVAGAALAELVPAVRRLRLLRRFAYSYLLGIAWVAGALYAGSHLGVLPLRAPAVLVIAAVPVAVALVTWPLRRRRGGSDGLRARHRGLLAWPVPGTVLALAATALAGWISLAVFADAATRPLADWDGRMTWATQARYLRAEGTVHPTVLVRARWFISHPEYPLLLPLAQVAAQEVAGAEEDEQPFRAFYAAFYPVLLLLLFDGALHRAGRTAATLLVLLVAPLPLLAFGEGSAAGAYSDLPLACFYGAGLLLLLRPRLGAADGLAAGLLLAAAALTKNEGALLAPLAVFLAVSYRLPFARRRGTAARPARRLRLGRLVPAGVAALCVAAALVLLSSWRAEIPNRQDEAYFELLTPARFAAGLGRIPDLVPLLLRKTFLSEEWLLFWWVALAIVAAGAVGLRRRGGVLALAAAAPPAIGLVAYAVHWDPLYLAGVTWSRLLLQGVVPFAVLLALALRPVLAGALRPASRDR
jgi:hypothetical protein